MFLGSARTCSQIVARAAEADPTSLRNGITSMSSLRKGQARKDTPDNRLYPALPALPGSTGSAGSTRIGRTITWYIGQKSPIDAEMARPSMDIGSMGYTRRRIQISERLRFVALNSKIGT